MSNELNTSPKVEPTLQTPQSLGVTIAEMQILYLSSSKNRALLGVRDHLANELFYSEKNLNSLPEEQKLIATEAYKERMQLALSGKNGKAIKPELSNETDLQKAA